MRRYMNTDGNSPEWDLIRLAYSSCADTAIFPLQDILSLPSQARMNTPGTQSGNWLWRFRADDLNDEYSQRLLYLNRIFKRNIQATATADDFADEQDRGKPEKNTQE